mmetsp:Transcript_64090/g.169858  ORF Transcript_64090/g.169858 Transcript_64090/m.169858 type:complete len:212 (+) Transcript_64090:142-777(+)
MTAPTPRLATTTVDETSPSANSRLESLPSLTATASLDSSEPTLHSTASGLLAGVFAGLLLRTLSSASEEDDGDPSTTNSVLGMTANSSSSAISMGTSASDASSLCDDFDGSRVCLSNTFLRRFSSLRSLFFFFLSFFSRRFSLHDRSGEPGRGLLSRSPLGDRLRPRSSSTSSSPGLKISLAAARTCANFELRCPCVARTWRILKASKIGV